MTDAAPESPQEAPKEARATSYGETSRPSPVDKLGVWLSERGIRAAVGDFAGKRIGDFGCGYQATFVRRVLDDVSSAVLVDVSLAGDLKAHPKVEAIEGTLPEAMAGVATGSLDVVLCISALEHLWKPAEALAEFRRVVAPGGVVLLNVPTWLGKRFLELSAFRLGLSPAEEMDDHKAYYDPSDLWPMLVASGFRPRLIDCHRHKFGLNTFAACRVDATGD